MTRLFKISLIFLLTIAVIIPISSCELDQQTQDITPISELSPPENEAVAEEIINYRREQMQGLSAHYRSLEAIIDENAPFSDQALIHVESLMAINQFLTQGFPPETAMEEGEWGAKPLIWDEPDEFTAIVVAFQDRLASLKSAITEQASQEEVSEALNQARQQCLDCHQVYRVRQP
ncbi:cytochrome c [Euhalothece natronophila Z-M001]|uniref:Cytochrome c n=1 Tax=Euhalothece natronophila Z-M001 TaxID=522448 RepID=A0A5B8NPP9_9CHRO|nr:cytochrome c [Euhalothece natronophila]QDZ40179.1 cytochrome c [Euhalothece natronophila Z-M001]